MSKGNEQQSMLGDQGFVTETGLNQNTRSSGLIRAALFGVVLFLAVLGFSSVVNSWFWQPDSPEIQAFVEPIETDSEPGVSPYKKLEAIWLETRALLETQFESKRNLLSKVSKIEGEIKLAGTKVVQAENSLSVAEKAVADAKEHYRSTAKALAVLEEQTPEEAFEDAQLALNRAKEDVEKAHGDFDRAKAEQKRIETTVTALRRAAAAAEAAASASRLVMTAAASAKQAVFDNQDVISEADSQALNSLETDFFAEARQQAESVAKSSKAAQNAVDVSEVRLGILGRKEASFKENLAEAHVAEKRAREQLKSIEAEITAHLQKMLLVEKENNSARSHVASTEKNFEEKQAALQTWRDSVNSLKLQLDETKSSAEKYEKTLDIVRSKFEETEISLKKLHREQTEKNAVTMAKLNAELNEKLRGVIGGSAPDHPIFDRLVFSSGRLFKPGSAVLGEGGKKILLKVTPVLQTVVTETPANIDWVLRVDGHTDNQPLNGTGKYKDNWELSQARALSVVRFLITSSSLKPTQLSANSYGEFHPLTDGTSEAELAKNRRIELTLAAR